jgi:hypothetical protein
MDAKQLQRGILPLVKTEIPKRLIRPIWASRLEVGCFVSASLNPRHPPVTIVIAAIGQLVCETTLSGGKQLSLLPT